MANERRRPRPSPDEAVDDAPGPLAGVVRRGALISAVAFGLVRIVSLIGNVALARLLSPSEVGIFAAGTVLSVFLITLAQGGLRFALIQRERDIEDTANTVFWATAGVGLMVSVVTIAAAPVLGHFFGNNLVTAVAVATSGLLLLESLTTAPDGIMQRRFNFLRRLVVDPSRAIAYAATAVALAASGFGVWSMVLGQYAAVIVWLVGSWSLARWRPGRGRPSVRLWRELVGFSRPIVVQDIVFYGRDAAQTAILGRSLGPVALGNYQYGSRIGMLPGAAVFEIGSYALFPALSRLAGDPERMRVAFLRALRWMWFAAAPTAALVVALGEDSVVILFGDRWRDAGLLVVALAGYGLGVALQEAPAAAIMARGRSVLFYRTAGLWLVLGIGFVCALLPWGLVGVGIAISAVELIIGFVFLVLAKPIVGYRFSTIARILAPAAVAASLALLAVLALRRVMGPVADLPTAGALGVLFALSVVLILCYLVCLTILDYRQVLDVIAKLRRRL